MNESLWRISIYELEREDNLTFKLYPKYPILNIK